VSACKHSREWPDRPGQVCPGGNPTEGIDRGWIAGQFTETRPVMLCSTNKVVDDKPNYIVLTGRIVLGPVNRSKSLNIAADVVRTVALEATLRVSSSCGSW
jgi:hypothetical protein